MPEAGKYRPKGPVVIDCQVKSIHYGKFQAVRDSVVPIEKNKITGFIGPSGCGKSTVLRSLNRMNDLVDGFRFDGHVHYHDKDIYAQKVDPVVVRRYIGMVFQQPNPFSMSIYDNVAFGLRLNRLQGRPGRTGGKGPARRRPVGRGQEQAEVQRSVAVRRPAAAAVHRPGDRHRARRAADGRALFGAGPHRHAPDRRVDARSSRSVTRWRWSPTTCSRRRAWRIPRPSSPWIFPKAGAPVISWRWGRPARSSNSPEKN